MPIRTFVSGDMTYAQMRHEQHASAFALMTTMRMRRADEGIISFLPSLARSLAVAGLRGATGKWRLLFFAHSGVMRDICDTSRRACGWAASCPKRHTRTSQLAAASIIAIMQQQRRLSPRSITARRDGATFAPSRAVCVRSLALRGDMLQARHHFCMKPR